MRTSANNELGSLEMTNAMPHEVTKAVDGVQERLTSYARALNYGRLTPEAVHAAKVRIVDTLGALIGGFFAEPCRISRNLAAQMPHSSGSTVIGTRIKTTPDMAAFVNAATARYIELTDSNHVAGSFAGHPSDVITPMLAAAEHAQRNGREFIAGVVLAYEVYLRIADVFKNRPFDHTNICCLSTAVGAGKLLGLSDVQLSHCISMAVVPNNTLRQVRLSHLSMFKAVTSGQAARAGIFAALLARAGMEGPHLPFEGKAGWCDHVAANRFTLGTMGGGAVPFRILSTLIKLRPACGTAMSSVLAAEKLAPFKNIKNIKQVIVEVYKYAMEQVATGQQHWNPGTKETADHSAPYLVAATLMEGTITLRSFSDKQLWNPELRALLQKVEVIENNEFSQAYERVPQEHKTRVTVVTNDGKRVVGEAGGDDEDMAGDKTPAQITEKFRGLCEDYLGAKQTAAVLDQLWHLEEVDDVSALAAAFALD